MTAAFLAGLVAGYGVAVPVGAIAVLILGLSARTSFRVGAAGALGVATADGLYAAVAVLGGAAVAGLVAPVAGPLRVAAALVLLALAGHGTWRAVRPRRAGGPREAPRGMDTPARAFAGVLALTLLNPATVVYFAALVMGRRDVGANGPPAAGLFVLGAFLASASWQLLIAGGGTLVGRMLAGPRGRLVTGLLSSAIIGALAVAVLLAD
ncbi:LysE family transporter [Micromonospora sp. CPCC 205711]|uniref:LysE family transporter n=1 Tax=Micromonospora sp. CPCC 205547 TaxID=3122400 RepID=UPI002FEF3365